TLSVTLGELKDLMSALNNRVTTAEQRVSNMEDAQQDISCEMIDLKKQVLDLQAKLDDQENYARWNNVRFIGFPKGVENGKPVKFLQEVLPTLLELPCGTVLDVERAHRSLAPKPADGQRPCPFIVKFLRYPVCEQILTAVKSMGSLQWNGNKIMVFLDLSRELMERKQKFMPVKKILQEKGLKYGLFYPATLKLTCDGETRSFMEPQAAEEFL
uniref:L1 transposable element RRM domain-containing protein n=1 Tax=Latimeria chalumnae TaxID=7897 RepID=H2ZZ05_LATCH